MKLLKTKTWTWLDIGLLKWSILLFGLVLGSHFYFLIADYELILLVIAILLAVKPTVDYFRD
jgi:hypothetical protein